MESTSNVSDAVIEHLNDDIFVVLDDYASIDASRLTPGERPIPALSSLHYQSIRDSIAVNGQFEPILVTTNRVICDGLLRWRACLELGKKVLVRYIDAAQASNCWLISCCKRELTIVDRAWLIDYVEASKLYEAEPAIAGGDERIDDRIARFFRNELGWQREASTGKQIQRHRRLCRYMKEASEELISQLAKCSNVNAALKLVKPPPQKRKDPIQARLKLSKDWIHAFGQAPGIDHSEIQPMEAVIIMAVRKLLSHTNSQRIFEIVTQVVCDNNVGQTAA